MDKLKTVRMIASVYCDYLNHYLCLMDDLGEPRSIAEWNELQKNTKELRKTFIDPLYDMLNHLGVSAVKEEGDLIKVKFDDGSVAGWKIEIQTLWVG